MAPATKAVIRAKILDTSDSESSGLKESIYRFPRTSWVGDGYYCLAKGSLFSKYMSVTNYRKILLSQDLQPVRVNTIPGL